MQLWSKEIPYYEEDVNFVPYIIPYINENAKLAIVLCPGGGYRERTDHEGEQVGQWLQSIGIAAFILGYRVAPCKTPAPLSDALRAMRVVRKEVQKYGIQKVGIMGFSAGGHLAATASVHYDKNVYGETDAIDSLSARPDFSVLCYPVMDMFDYRHDPSRERLLGKNPVKAMKTFYSPQMQVTEDTPPAFLWHTATDRDVPAENSILYALALAQWQIPYELHIYPRGKHGQNIALNDAYLHQWTESLRRWLNWIEEN